MRGAQLKILSVITMFPVFILLFGCQETQLIETNENKVTKTSDIAAEDKNQAEVSNATKLKKPLLCKAGSPPVKDFEKLKVMLTKSGKITTEMSAEQAHQVIKSYIKKKQDAFKRCQK